MTADFNSGASGPQLIEAGAKEGARIAADGRGVKVNGAPNGFFLGATVLDEVQAGMTIAKEEIFGPVLNVMRFSDLDAAIEQANRSPYGNGASIFTRSGKAAREFKHRIKCGMVGINIGVPASWPGFLSMVGMIHSSATFTCKARKASSFSPNRR